MPGRMRVWGLLVLGMTLGTMPLAAWGSSSEGTIEDIAGIVGHQVGTEVAIGDSVKNRSGLRGNGFSRLRWNLEDYGIGTGTMVEAIVRSFLMIIVSEIGDETFIVAALLAMRYQRMNVLLGALSSLYIMTILSACMGMVMPKLLTPVMTHRVSTIMYLVFAIRLFYLAENEEESDEYHEVEEKLNGRKRKRRGVGRFFHCSGAQVFIEAFILTFCAEWGDRSQIATITLAAHNSVTGVVLGGLIGHTVCTTVAVLGGKLIADKISQKTLSIAGSCTFFLFFVLNLLREF